MSETPKAVASDPLHPVVTLDVEPSDAGQRLDHYLQSQLPKYSRSRLKTWINDGQVLIDGAESKPSTQLRGGEHIEVMPRGLPPLKAEPEDLPIEILYEDDAVIAVNKPAGIVVHAGAGRHEGTLVNRLVHHFQSLSQVGGELRPGIVHRLDKDTSGVLLVARTDAAHRALAEQFSGRTVEKTYLALVHGNIPTETGRVTKSIARDPIRRTRMTTRTEKGRSALTYFKVLKRYGKYTYLEVKIGTGRTHQIRVHMQSLRHPVAGDTLYGAPKAPEATRDLFLHSWKITFTSPATGEPVTVEAPLPKELQSWLAALE